MTIEGLNDGLCIQAEHSDMAWWVETQTDRVLFDGGLRICRGLLRQRADHVRLNLQGALARPEPLRTKRLKATGKTREV